MLSAGARALAIRIGICASGDSPTMLRASDTRYSGSRSGNVAELSVRYRLSANGFPAATFATAFASCGVSWLVRPSSVNPRSMYVGSSAAARLFASVTGFGQAAKSDIGWYSYVASTRIGSTLAPPRLNPVLPTGSPPSPVSSVFGFTVSIPSSAASGAKRENIPPSGRAGLLMRISGRIVRLPSSGFSSPVRFS